MERAWRLSADGPRSRIAIRPEAPRTLQAVNTVRVKAVCVFRRDDRILVIRAEDTASKEPFFVPPGGGVEFGELAEDTTRRELTEEFGVEVEHLMLLGVFEERFSHSGIVEHEVVFAYLAQVLPPTFLGEEPVLGTESTGAPLKAEWMPLSQFGPRGARLYPEGLLSALGAATAAQHPLPTLETDRLILRPFRPDDAATVQRLAGVPDVALTTQNIPYPYEDGMAEAWIATHGPAWDHGRFLTLAVTTPEEGVVGAVSLHIAAAHERGELGYWVGQPFWNRGYATEAARTMMTYGFEELGLNRVQARHMTRNPASGRVMEKLGMHTEGVQRGHARAHGEFEDVAMYGILRSDL